MTTVAQFTICYYQTLDHHGQLHTELSPYTAQTDHLMGFYRSMLSTRLFDQRAVSLQRTGRLGTYASALGQEAIGTALGYAMRPQDCFIPCYREYGTQLLRGVTMAEILLYWGGDERGMDFSKAREDFPICVPIASQTCHAVGIAYAMQLRRQPRVAVCVIGDGATSKGDFYEALNAAGVWRLPLLFVINNNQWAISLPRSSQSAAQTLAQKAIAAGIPAEQVDGNDVIGCYERFALALEVCRKGQGPYLIEALSYRLCDHTTADDGSRYRDEQELQKQWQYDPLQRLKTWLLTADNCSERQLDELQSACKEEVEAEVQRYLQTPPQPPQAMFDYLYAELPAALQGQRNEVVAKGTAHG